MNAGTTAGSATHQPGHPVPDLAGNPSSSNGSRDRFPPPDPPSGPPRRSAPPRLLRSGGMTIGTWNVNGIRARQSQLQEWVQRDRPDIVCLQEIKAGSDQVPTALCEMEDYWCYWHGAKGYSGVGLHVQQDVQRRPSGVRASGLRLREPHRDHGDCAA